MPAIYGQDHILRELDSELTKNRLSHAYLLVGAPNIGKMSLAIHFAQTINCLHLDDGAPCQNCNQCTRISNAQHSDVRIVELEQMEGAPERTRRDISIRQIRRVIEEVHLTPYASSHKIIIFDGAELLSDEAANALLLTLEEPPKNVIFLLLSDREHLLPSTLRSRCRKLQLHLMPKLEISKYLIEKHEVEPVLAEQLARLSSGRLGWAINSITNDQNLTDRANYIKNIYETSQSALKIRFDYASMIAQMFRQDRISAKNILFCWQGWWRDLLLVKVGTEDYITNLDYINELKLHATTLTQADIVKFLKTLDDTLSNLDHNANPRLAMEVLMLSLPVSD